MTTNEEQTFGPEIAGLLKRLREGDLNAADPLWDLASNTLDPDKRQQLQKLVDVELDKMGE